MLPQHVLDLLNSSEGTVIVVHDNAVRHCNSISAAKAIHAIGQFPCNSRWMCSSSPDAPSPVPMRSPSRTMAFMTEYNKKKFPDRWNCYHSSNSAEPIPALLLPTSRRRKGSCSRSSSSSGRTSQDNHASQLSGFHSPPRKPERSMLLVLEVPMPSC